MNFVDANEDPLQEGVYVECGQLDQNKFYVVQRTNSGWKTMNVVNGKVEPYNGSSRRLIPTVKGDFFQLCPDPSSEIRSRLDKVSDPPSVTSVLDGLVERARTSSKIIPLEERIKRSKRQ